MPIALNFLFLVLLLPEADGKIKISLHAKSTFYIRVGFLNELLMKMHTFSKPHDAVAETRARAVGACVILSQSFPVHPSGSAAFISDFGEIDE